MGCQPGPASDSATGGPSAAQRPTAPPDAEPDCFVIVEGEPDYGAPPLTVRFETEASCSGGPVTYSWDFGDGGAGGDEPRPSHTYERHGEYTVVVRVAAPGGGTSQDELEITVDSSFEE